MNIFKHFLTHLKKVVPKHWRDSYKTWRLLAVEYGHLETMRLWDARDAQGHPLPWYTYPAIDYLRQMDLQGKTVFEFGSGNSTLYWASRARSVISVENSPEWHEKIRGSLPDNARLELVEKKENYAASIEKIDTDGVGFDIIVVDGVCRHDCASNALKHLRTGGFIVLDNSDWYPNTALLLARAGLLRVDFFGFSPINCYTLCTSIFFHRGCTPLFRLIPDMIGGVDGAATDDGETVT